MSPAEKLAALLHEHPSSPFLFVGSGFSQRYLGTPTWEALLRQFAQGLEPFEYYFATSDSKLPRCASLIADDFAKKWWKDEVYARQREDYKHLAKSSSSALKIAVADHMRKEVKLHRDTKLTDELNALRTINAEGIITTNWDCLLESIFPGYKVYVGQQSIVTKTPQNIGEIFKIHGCCTDPNSLVLTDQDYSLFRDKQAYLAAKLITIFVEHPVIFIGYSVSDPNILELLRSILRGLGTDEIKSLQRNLIFLQRSNPGRPEGVMQTILYVDETTLPITHLITDDFVSVYSALAHTKLKLPARVLRFCKEQLYEIVASKEPSDKLCLTNIEDIKDKNDIEFVVGLGVPNSAYTDRGYLGITIRELFEQVIFDHDTLDARRVLEQVIPHIDAGTNFIPCFYYLNKLGILSNATTVNDSITRLSARTKESFKTISYKKAGLRETQKSGQTFEWMAANLPPEKTAVYAPYFPEGSLSLVSLQQFCQEHFEKAFQRGPYSTLYRKLFCLYDLLKFGKITSP